MYGDIFLVPPTDYKFSREAFQEDGVIAVKKATKEELSKGGAVVLDGNGFMIDLVEKAAVDQVPKNAYYNAGIYLLTPRYSLSQRRSKNRRAANTSSPTP